MNTNTLINLIIIFLMTVVFGYLLGLSVVNVVDHRLSDISINLPKITLPRQNIYVDLNGQPKSQPLNITNTFQTKPSSGTEAGPNYQLNPTQTQMKPLKPNLNEGFTSNMNDDTDLLNQTPPNQSSTAQNVTVYNSREIPPGIYQKDFVSPIKPTTINRGEQVRSLEVGHINPNQPGQIIESQKIESKKIQSINNTQIGCRNDSDCNVVYGNGENKCLSNNKCYCVKGSGLFCHYGPTYYKDTKDMTDRQLQKFKLRAKFDKMTVQDYVNWLMLFEDEPDQLAPRHLNNLFKILKGVKITLNDIPRDRIPPPMTAQDYFTQLYTLDDQINIYSPAVSDTAGLQIPANYSNYSTFQAPQNLKHLSARPLTLDEEIAKDNNQPVLQLLQPQPSNIWDTATGDDHEALISGQLPLENNNLKVVNKIRSQISNQWHNTTN